MCPLVQPVKEDQREYSLLLRWLGLALMVVSMKRKRLVGRRRSFWHRMVECCECSLFVSFFAFHLFSSLHLFSLFTRLVTFVHAYKIYIVVVQRKIILFHLTFFRVSILVCLLIRISDPLAYCFWVIWYTPKTLVYMNK